MSVVTLCLAVLTASSPLAASRARYGGTLKVALVGKVTSTDPWLADAPAEAALLSLTSHSLCSTSTRATGGWAKLLAAPTPYRALLFPLRDDGSLAFPWPDLDKSLCHPALSLPGAGPFTSSTAGTFVTARDFPAGRAFIDELQITASDARGAERLFSQHRASLALGLAPTDAQEPPPLPFATYLAFSRTRVGDTFRAALESAINRTDLTRFFVRGPAAPLPGLLPGLSSKPAPAKPAPLTPAKEVTLLYDASLDDQRAVAERLQVRLHPFGYKLAIKGLPRAELRTRWKAGDFDLMLSAVLLPPFPAPALAVVLELGGQHDQLQKYLPPLGAIADDAARAQATRDLASSLPIDLVPLYVQGLSVQAGRDVQALKLDGYGLPRFDDLFLGQD